MILLPIVERELRVAARLTATYRNRAIAAGVVAVAAMVMLLFGSFVQSPSLVGGAMFKTLAILTLAFCMLEGVRKTADCLSEEKRDGTLGLLFLTDLKGHDIVFGKLAAMSLNSIYGLLAILPMLALSMLLGGVTPGEYWRMVLALINILFFSLSVGMWVSSWSHSEYQAMGRTLLVIAIFAAIPLLIPVSFLWPFSPIYAFRTAFAVVYPGTAQGYWRSLETTHAISWAMLVWSSVVASRCWTQEKFGEPSTRLRRAHIGELRRRTILRNQMLEINPAFWLATRNPAHRLFLTILMLVAGANSVLLIYLISATISFRNIEGFFVVVLALNFILKSLVATQSCHCLAEARRNNALEMLLSTPLTVDQIIRGQIQALKRIFLVPIIIILALESAGPIGGLFTLWQQGRGEDESAYVIVGLLLLTFFFLDMVAVTWAGMWFGLSSIKENQAAVRTIFFVLIIPLFFAPLWCFGAPFFIGIPIFWIIYANRKLHAELRLVAAQRYTPARADSGWLPIAGSPNV
jgi:hypothetical protein